MFKFDGSPDDMQAFVAALTGDNSVTAGITDATQGAYNFGLQIKSTIEFVISIKDELVVLGGVIVTVFAVNKVIAFATAIGTLVTAMKTLRTAAAGAAVATAFATGGASVGLATAALAAVAATYGLSKFAAEGDQEVAGGFSGSGFSNLPSGGFSGVPSGGGTPFGGGTPSGGGFPSGGTGKGVGAVAGASSLTDLANKLVAVQDKITDVTFATLTGGISKAAAQKQLDQLQAEFRVLEKQTNALVANPQILINVSALDSESAARAVAKALNDSAARSTPAIDYRSIREKAG